MPETDKQTNSVFHDLTNEAGNSVISSQALLLFSLAIVLGIIGGYFLSRGKMFPASSPTNSSTSGNASSLSKGTIIGSNDTNTFKDTTEGIMKAGGIEGEGQYHLVRPGGDSQNVYLTSSIIDLSQFTGKKVKVNGQTQKAKKAGWLMDVGRVEVLE